MKNDIYLKKKLTSSWFYLLQQTICYELQKIEINFSKKIRKKPKFFEIKNWNKSNKINNGGGTYSIIRNGNAFDSN